MTEKLRIAMLGLGEIAQKAYLPIVANHSLITPILCTRNRESLEQLKNRYRVKECYTTVNDLIDAKPDAVMVHTATTSHFAIAEQLLSANIATFIDKPASFDLAEVERLVHLARLSNTPLYLGFNRRFAPLVNSLHNKSFQHIRWQKNRVNLPGQARDFIFNDFIHVVDGVRSLAGVMQPINSDKVNVSTQIHNGLLSHIHVSFEHGGCLLEASMNRNSGFNEERIEAFGLNEKIQIDNLTTGVHYHNGSSKPLGFSDWQSYLYSRGFVDMIEDWLAVINKGHSSDSLLNDILLTHQFCELLVNKVA